MKLDKAPGPDGFTAHYYKAFMGALGVKFLSAFNSLEGGSAPPPDTLRALITVIPKEGKDPARCENYRPISLLNLDLKIFSKILASRLTPLMSSLVGTDQVGFIPGREARDNTTRVLDLTHVARFFYSPRTPRRPLIGSIGS